MITVSVLYPRTPASHFDHTYYLEKHMPLVESRWRPLGLSEVRLLRGSSTLDGSPCAYELIGLLSFPTLESMQQALAAAGPEIIGDIPNFTNVQPLIQINQPSA